MKTASEIAWDLLKTPQRFYSKQVSEVIDFTLGVDEVADLCGIPVKIVHLLQKKQKILESLSDLKELSLVRQVIEEIEQGKPHYPLEADLSNKRKEAVDDTQ